jgi:VWFA-related protein
MIPPRSQRFLLLIALFCVYSFSPSSAFAQQNNDSLVFYVSVTDENAKPFSGLKPENFSITVDKSQREIKSFRAESVPASIGILVDSSGSMRPTKSKVVEEFQRKMSEGLSRFVGVSNPENYYFAAAFDAKVAFPEAWIKAGERVDLFSSGDPRGTALYDSMYYGLQRMATARHSRRVLLVVSDGMDNASKRIFKDVRELIKNSDVTVYAIGIIQPEGEGTALGMEGQGVLDELTGVSGGRTFFLRYDAKVEIVKGVFDLLARDIHGQYQLTIDKEPGATPKKWRKIKLKLNKGDAKGWPKLFVKTRDGYFQ